MSINALRWQRKETQTRLSMPVCKRFVQRNWPEIDMTFDEVLAGGGAVERPNWAISKPPDGGCGALIPALLL